jgi:hypothetical protein
MRALFLFFTWVAVWQTFATAQFIAKWDQFLPIVVTPGGNGNVIELGVWDDSILAVIGETTFQSSDGETWKPANHTYTFDKIENQVLLNLSADKRSSDGVHWDSIVTIDGKSMPVSDIAYGGGWWVAVNNNGQIFRSSDLTVWRSERTPTARGIRSVEYLSEKFIALSTDPDRPSDYLVLTSVNGEFWTIENIDQRIRTAHDFNPKLVGEILVLYNDFIFTSHDGVTWKRAQSSGLVWTSDFAFGDGFLLEVGGRGKCNVSSDLGATWESVEINGNWDLNAAAYFRGHWFVGGANGALLMAKPVEAPLLPTLPHLTIQRDGLLRWAGDADAAYTIEDSLDLRSWRVLARADPGVQEFKPPVSSQFRFFRLREDR